MGLLSNRIGRSIRFILYNKSKHVHKELENITADKNTSYHYAGLIMMLLQKGFFVKYKFVVKVETILMMNLKALKQVIIKVDGEIQKRDRKNYLDTGSRNSMN